LFKKAGFDNLSWQREVHKYSLARTFAFGLMGQSRASIYCLFNL
jgi:hypothetical protein